MDDGHNTKGLSQDFVSRHRPLLHKPVSKSILPHLSKGLSETARKVVVNAEVEIGNHRYCSSWVVAICNYDILLGMLWDLDTSLQTDYLRCKVTVNIVDLPVLRSHGSGIEMGNMESRCFVLITTQEYALVD